MQRFNHSGFTFAICVTLALAAAPGFCMQWKQMPPAQSMLVKIESPPNLLEMQGLPASRILDRVTGHLIGYSEGENYHGLPRPGQTVVRIEPWPELQSNVGPRRIVDPSTHELIGLTLPAKPHGSDSSKLIVRAGEPMLVRFEASSMNGQSAYSIHEVVSGQAIGYTDQVYHRWLEPTVVKVVVPEHEGSEIVEVSTNRLIGHTSSSHIPPHSANRMSSI